MPMYSILRKGAYILKSIYIKIFVPGIHVSVTSEIKSLNLINRPVRIGKSTYISGSIGKYSYIGNNCKLNANIGSFCSVANNVKTIEGLHPLHFVSTSPSFFSTSKQCGSTFATENILNDISTYENEKVGVLIENDVWIGENVIIKGGIKIGTGSCIGMGAVVIKDVEPYSIVGGCPAKEIRKRFDPETVDLLLKSKWWEENENWLRRNWRIFSDISEFCITIQGK